jgi:hypothetical protein
MAGAVNIGAIFFPYLSPVVGIVAGGNSSFVKFNAYRCLIDQIVRTAVMAVIVAASLAYSVYSMVQAGVFKDGLDLSKIDWVTLILKSAATWAAFAIWGLWNTIAALMDARQAFAGRIPSKMGWMERWAAKRAGLRL